MVSKTASQEPSLSSYLIQFFDDEERDGSQNVVQSLFNLLMWLLAPGGCTGLSHCASFRIYGHSYR
jgi:hypothetical protein